MIFLRSIEIGLACEFLHGEAESRVSGARTFCWLAANERYDRPAPCTSKYHSAAAGCCTAVSMLGDRKAPWRNNSHWITLAVRSRGRLPVPAARAAATPAAWPVSQHWGIS